MNANFLWGLCVGFLACPLVCAAVLWRLVGDDLRSPRQSGAVTPDVDGRTPVDQSLMLTGS